MKYVIASVAVIPRGRLQRRTITESEVPEFNFAENLFRSPVGPYSGIRNCGLFGKQIGDPSQGCGATLENIDHPAQRDNRPCQLHHIGVECGKVTDVDTVLYDFAPTHQQYDNDCHSE